MSLLLEVEPCCDPWDVSPWWKDGASVSRVLLTCRGCGQRRVVTCTSRPARCDETAGENGQQPDRSKFYLNPKLPLGEPVSTDLSTGLHACPQGCAPSPPQAIRGTIGR